MPTPIDAAFDLASLSLPVPNSASTNRSELGQEEFFQLMLTQLQNQDPFKPMENGEFLSQIAQFSSVKSLGDLNSSFETLSASMLSSQALQGAALIGRAVLLPSDQAVLHNGAVVTGAVELDTSTSALRIQVRDAAGQVIRDIDLGTQPAGLVRFLWGGETNAGVPADPGVYTIDAQVFDGTGMQATPVLVNSLVLSVGVDPAGNLLLNVEGRGDVPFDHVREIGF
jgi:flagellar basal-body rod modification protein FlgD